ncbi:MAG: tryptophan 7-halogenase [Planctomycetota bacterium]|nr:tryptophan 7-halogenase [Planctomycetota bacterium]
MLRLDKRRKKAAISVADQPMGDHHTPWFPLCYPRGSIMTNSRASAIPQSARQSAAANLHFDFIVIGSGFAGSLIACILQSQGRTVAIVDRSSHPRFAIGESSTPAAGLILSSLADQYDLPWLKPFARYGTWKQAYPKITTGRKRGFSYFQHEPGKPFQPRADHSNELLAAASSSDELSDTQWLRSDVDAYFFKKTCETGVAPFENSEITTLHQNQTGWLVEVNEATPRQGVRRRTLSSGFLIDASGAGQVLARHLGIEDESAKLATNSRAIFAHVTGLPEWHSILEQAVPGSTSDHPFHCDHAAQHHILEEGWMWWLRFDSDVTSVGLVLNNRPTGSIQSVAESGEGLTASEEFFDVVNRYPSLRDAFADASVINPESMPVRTPGLQRLSSEFNGANWAMLPHTAGFIDPLHSTGIAHSLIGVERLANTLLKRRQHANDNLPILELWDSGSVVEDELTLIDQLVAGCYDAIAEHSFTKLAAFTMCYFAAATTWERRCLNNRSSSVPESARGRALHRPALLCADVADFRAAVFHLRGQMPEETEDSFERLCKKILTPFNHVGLFEPPIPNMYGGTAVPTHRTFNP